MKRISGLLIILVMLTLAAPALFAQEQEHGEFGAFADYVRLRNAGNSNFWGGGASLGFNLNNYIQLEAAGSYDPEKTVAQTLGSGINTTVNTTTTNVGLRLYHFEFGPKIQTGFHGAKLYLVAKGGLLDFNQFNGSAVAPNGVGVGQFRTSTMNAVFYPGVGFEIGKRFGIRAEVGDLMYFDNGANHNIRVSVGPKISF